MKKIPVFISLIFCFVFLLVVNLNAGFLIQKFTSAGASGWFGYLTEASQDTGFPPTDGFIVCSALDSPSNTGTVTKIAIWSSCTEASRDIKLGLYTDDAGVPDSLVGTETEFANVGTWSLEWHEFAGLSYSVNSANSYWICATADDNFVSQLTLYYDTPGGTNRYYDNNTNYATAWPSTYGSASSSAAKYAFKAYFAY